MDILCRLYHSQGRPETYLSIPTVVVPKKRKSGNNNSVYKNNCSYEYEWYFGYMLWEFRLFYFWIRNSKENWSKLEHQIIKCKALFTCLPWMCWKVRDFPSLSFWVKIRKAPSLTLHSCWGKVWICPIHFIDFCDWSFRYL